MWWQDIFTCLLGGGPVKPSCCPGTPMTQTQMATCPLPWWFAGLAVRTWPSVWCCQMWAAGEHSSSIPTFTLLLEVLSNSNVICIPTKCTVLAFLCLFILPLIDCIALYVWLVDLDIYTDKTADNTPVVIFRSSLVNPRQQSWHIQTNLNHLSSSFCCLFWASAAHLDHVYMPKCTGLLPCDWLIEMH